MNTSTRIRPSTLGPRPSRGFTMIEIAISLAVIGFALVAIIGILPTGMNVQRDNRQETIINQDASIFMNAVRNGERGLNDLTNYVVAITNNVSFLAPNGTVTGSRVYWYTPSASGPVPGFPLVNGYSIIGLLSTPKYIYSDGRYISNHVVATVRSISGPASEKSPQNNPIMADLTMNYRLISEVSSYGTNFYNPNWTNFTAPGLAPQEVNNRKAYFAQVKYFETNLHDLRLTFRWPVLPSGSNGPNRLLFRTMVSGPYTNDPPNSPFFFFQPNTFFKGT